MSKFDPDRFEDKYVHYLPELQRAYKRAFNRMNDEFDSTLVHAIDQQVLNESEPFYEPDDHTFRIELPPDPYDRLNGVPVAEERFRGVLAEYIDTLIDALEAEFLA